jgi:DNA-binding transcriptional MerR regulator
VTRGPGDRSHLSIGEVLSLLQEEFPDVTISKIRFLESQGLLDPERTPSGYRKFYEGDIDRLRWILRQQKDHYLPLKVIKDRLEDIGSTRVAPVEHNGSAAAGAAEPEPAGAAVALAVDDRPAAGGRDATGPLRLDGIGQPPETPPDASGPGGTVTAPETAAPARPVAAPRSAGAPAAASEPAAAPVTDGGRSARPRPAPAAAGAGALSLTVDELAQASGLTARDVRDLERYGLLEGSAVGDATYYDADALVVARTAAGFLQHGIEARHVRTYKVAVDREAGLFEQIVLPLLKQRNPDARRKATQTVVELIRLGDDMRSVLLRRELRDHLPPG